MRCLSDNVTVHNPVGISRMRLVEYSIIRVIAQGNTINKVNSIATILGTKLIV